MLKVIQHQQQALVAQIIFYVLQQGPSAFSNFELLSNAGDELIGIGIVSQRDEVDAIRELIEHFSSQTLAEVFRDLCLSERSGVLALSREEVEKSIHFERGLIHFAASTNEEEDLGARLVEESKLSVGALAEAGGNGLAPDELAQALINRGLIGKAQLCETMQGIVESVVQSVFAWEGGSAHFDDTKPAPEFFESPASAEAQAFLRGELPW